MRDSKTSRKQVHNLIPDSSSSSSGCPSSTVSAWWQSIGFLETHARRQRLQYAKALSLSVCVQGKTVHRRLPFSNALPREACNNLAQPMKVNTFERALVEAFANRFTSRATAHQCAQMSVPVSSHGSRTNQELCTRAARCGAEKLMVGTIPGLLDDLLEVSKSGKKLFDILMIVTDPPQKPKRFCMTIRTVTWSLGMDRSPRFSETWRVAVKITRLSHRNINECSVGSGKCVMGTVCTSILPCKF